MDGAEFGTSLKIQVAFCWKQDGRDGEDQVQGTEKSNAGWSLAVPRVCHAQYLATATKSANKGPYQPRGRKPPEVSPQHVTPGLLLLKPSGLLAMMANGQIGFTSRGHPSWPCAMASC